MADPDNVDQITVNLEESLKPYVRYLIRRYRMSGTAVGNFLMEAAIPALIAKGELPNLAESESA